MNKYFFPLIILMVITLSLPASAASKKNRKAKATAVAAVPRYQPPLIPSSITVTLAQETVQEKPWYESPVMTGFAGAVGGFLLTSLTGFLNRWLVQKQGKNEYKRKLAESRRQKHLVELKNVYQTITLGIVEMTDFSTSYKNLSEGHKDALGVVQDLNDIALYDQVQTIKEHIELHLEALLPEVEKVWKNFREANVLVGKAKNDKYKDTKQLDEIAGSYDKVIKLLTGIKSKAAKSSRELQKV